MKKPSNYLKIFIVLVMVISLMQLSPIKAAEDITVSSNERIIISFIWSDTLEASPTIYKDLFDLSKTDWIYVYDNSDMREVGVIDENFEGITLNSEYDQLICSPKEGSANFYGANLIEEVSVVHDTTKPAAQYCDLRYFDKYTISNNSEDYEVYLFIDGDYSVDYVNTYSDGMQGDPIVNDMLPDRVYPAESIEFTATSEGAYDINEPILGGFYYFTEAIDYSVTREMSDSYAEINSNEYDMNGISYTVTSSASYDIEITSKSAIEYEATVYDSTGTSVETVTNGQGSDYNITIPAGGKIVFGAVDEADAILTLTNYSIYDDFISVSGLRKAAPAETKKIYIHFSNDSFTPSGLSQDDEGYYISTEVVYVDTDYTEEADTIGGFTIPSIKDTTGMAAVNNWYVYSYEDGSYFEATKVTGDKLVVEPLESDFYTQLLRSYGEASEYHLYAQWEVQTITQSGTYNLIPDVEYRLGSGSWTIGDDNCVYSGDTVFYLDSDAGSYEITLK